MDTSSFVAIGQQLQDFLTKQFSPPPGTKCELGFLGSGIAVAPESFLSQGQFNPARINTWLRIVADPIHIIIDGSVAPTQLTAAQLMEAICSFAGSAAPAGSDTATSFAKLKSQAMENLGGIMELSAAPLDWYDPAQIPRWPHCTLNTSTTSTSHEGTVESPPPPTEGNVPPLPRLWAWRKFPKVVLAESGTPIFDRHRLEETSLRGVERSQLNLSAVTAAETATVISPQLSSLNTANFSRIAQATNRVNIASIEQLPNISIAASTERSSVAANAQISSSAIAVSSTISQAAAQAVTSSVDSSSLSINLSYLFVDLSRMPWWNELLIMLDNWYVPGQRRATFVDDATTSRSIGVPVALVLTNNVQIQGTWSQSDLSAISSNTHIGPWALSGYQMSATDSLRQATLTLPGMQAIACIFRLLPPLPPVSDPSLPSSA